MEQDAAVSNDKNQRETASPVTTEDFRSVSETTEVVNAEPIDAPEVAGPPVDDVITIDRKIGATRAAVTLTSGLTVTGAWAAGDSQALRRLIESLIEVTDGATARVDRGVRRIADLEDALRAVRTQLRVALDEVHDLHTEREVIRHDLGHQLAEQLGEITTLRAEIDGARAIAMLSPDKAELVRERDQLRSALATEKRRADTAVAAYRELEERTSVDMAIAEADRAYNLRRQALAAVETAEEAFEDKLWKKGGRYLRLANTWIALLNAGSEPLEAPPE
jgi:chromosome segregation ATPase